MTPQAIEQQMKDGKLFPMYHVGGCGQIAFYTTKKLEIGDDVGGGIIIRRDGRYSPRRFRG